MHKSKSGLSVSILSSRCRRILHDDEFELRQDLQTTLHGGLRAADKNDNRLVPLDTTLTESEEETN